jgi:hypothetical protein
MISVGYKCRLHFYHSSEANQQKGKTCFCHQKLKSKRKSLGGGKNEKYCTELWKQFPAQEFVPVPNSFQSFPASPTPSQRFLISIFYVGFEKEVEGSTPLLTFTRHKYIYSFALAFTEFHQRKAPMRRSESFQGEQDEPRSCRLTMGGSVESHCPRRQNPVALMELQMKIGK